MFSCRRLLILALLVLGLFTRVLASGIFSDVERGDTGAVLKNLQAHPGIVTMTDDAGQSLLQIAAANGATSIARLLLEKGAATEANGGFNHETPLLRAINAGHTDIAELLIAHNARVNAMNENGETPLRLALELHNSKIVKLLRARGGMLAVANPVFTAVDRADLAMLQRLLAQHPTVLTTADKGGWMPIHSAALLGRLSVITFLLDHGAAIDREDIRGFTPLHLAVKSGKIPTASLLIEKGAKIDVGSFLTPLMLAAFDNKKAMVDLLLKHGAGLKERGHKGYSVMHYAVLGGSEEIVTTLLNAGANPNAMDEQGETPLHLKLPANMVQLLIAHGADVNARDYENRRPFSEGDTPLHIAALVGELETAKILLAHGANPNSRNQFGKTPLAIALENRQMGVANYLRAHGAQENIQLPGALYVFKKDKTLLAPLWYLSNWLGATLEAGDMPGSTRISYQDAIVEITVGQRGVVSRNKATYVPVRIFCNVFHVKLTSDNKRMEVTLTHPQTGDKLTLPTWSKSEYAWSTLALDAYGNAPKRITARLQAAPNVDVRDGNGMTALHWAARNGRTDIINMLLEHGASINTRDYNRQTPLHLAVAHKQQAAAELLIAKGALVNMRTSFGRTPLHMAAETGNAPLVALLLEKGAKTVMDYAGDSPIDLAVARHYDDIVDLLKNPAGKAPEKKTEAKKDEKTEPATVEEKKSETPPAKPEVKKDETPAKTDENKD